MRDQMTSHEQQQQQEEAARTSTDAASITMATHPDASVSAFNTVVMTTYKHTSDRSAAAGVSGGTLSGNEATPADADRCAPSNNAASTSSNIPVSISACARFYGGTTTYCYDCGQNRNIYQLLSTGPCLVNL